MGDTTMPSILGRIRSGLQSLLLQEGGQDLVEYALIIALVALAAVTSLKSVETAIAGVFTTINGKL
jgi:pilus assembly protein Flp/PilA